MPIVIVDDQEIEVGEHERLNGIQVAHRAGIDIPHYCWHPGLSVVASCRMCLVQTGRRNPGTGEIVMVPKLVPACQTPATDGTVFVTNSESVRAARAMVEEDLLLRHPIDCPICDKAGECYLQDYHFQHGQAKRRADLKPFTSRRRPVGDTVTLFVDRCVMCSRCVRFTREISGTSELMVVHRGTHEEIDVFPGYPLANKLAGNVVDLCPVGALGDKDFLYQQRVWFMKKHPGVCAGCATGCSIFVEENQDRIYRIKPRENPHVNQWWICDDGRYGFKHVHDAARRTEISRRDADGGYVALDWSQLPEELDAELRNAGPLAAVLSPFLTVEEAYLLASYLRHLDPTALLALGPIPQTGADEPFPAGFTIRAEKCPNRNGVEAILSRLAGELVTWDQLPDRLAARPPGALWLAADYPGPWLTDRTELSLDDVPLLVVQDLWDSLAWQKATYRLPGLAYAERAGSYVNIGHRLQSFSWAIRPPSGVVPAGQLYWQLSGRRGLYDPQSVLQEIAREMGYFVAAAGEVPESGVDLKVHDLAGV